MRDADPLPDSLTPADRVLLDAAIAQARKSVAEGGLPIGSAIGTPDGEVLAAGHNRRVQDGDPTAHAEMVCLKVAGRRRDWPGLTLATTLSPCVMCTGALLLYRVGRVVIGEAENFQGAEDLLADRGGVTLVHARDPVCIEMMRRFVDEHPDLWNEDIGVDPG
ncbi:MAG: nucleoside deaminase [Planctomycetota bacterium]